MGQTKKKETPSTSNSDTAIKSYVERFENLNEQKVALTEDFKILSAQVKSEGFDVATIKAIVKIRNNEAKAKEKMQLLQLYSNAVQLNLF